jgi:hypothetical protein
MILSLLSSTTHTSPYRLFTSAISNILVDFQIMYLIIREIEEQTSSTVEEKRKLEVKGRILKVQRA